jgi:short subunit dehydrogenase-like uncharacterized protein
MMQNHMIKSIAKGLAGAFVKGPDATQRKTARSYAYAKASNGSHSVEAWLDTIEAYQFTAEASVLAVEQTLERQPAGALTPALAFGKDFVLDINSTRRLDTLDVGDWESLV